MAAGPAVARADPVPMIKPEPRAPPRAMNFSANVNYINGVSSKGAVKISLMRQSKCLVCL